MAGNLYANFLLDFMFYVLYGVFFFHVVALHHTLFFILHCIRNGCALHFLHSFWFPCFFFADSFSISFSGWNFFFRCAHFYSSIAIFFVCLCIEKLFVLQFNMFPSLLPQPAISMRMFNVRTYTQCYVLFFHCVLGFLIQI